MKPPSEFTRIVNRKRYNVKTAQLLAGNDHWDGHNFERSGRNEFLYRTPNGAYFVVTLTKWEGERDTLEPVTQEEAIEYFEGMTVQRVTYQEAFPDVDIIDA